MLCVCVSVECLSCKGEDRLFRHLFRKYNQFIRPVENVSDPVTVEFEVSISQLVKVVRTHPNPYALKPLDYTRSVFMSGRKFIPGSLTATFFLLFFSSSHCKLSWHWNLYMVQWLWNFIRKKFRLGYFKKMEIQVQIQESRSNNRFLNIHIHQKALMRWQSLEGLGRKYVLNVRWIHYPTWVWLFLYTFESNWIELAKNNEKQ